MKHGQNTEKRKSLYNLLSVLNPCFIRISDLRYAMSFTENHLFFDDVEIGQEWMSPGRTLEKRKT